MIQERLDDGRGGYKTLTKDDKEYWNGPYRFEPFPKAFYRIENGNMEAPVCRVAKTSAEASRYLESDGWFGSPADAKKFRAGTDKDVAKQAAESNWTDRLMSAAAKAEKQAVDDQTDEMIVDVPAPKRRPGRPRTVTID